MIKMFKKWEICDMNDEGYASNTRTVDALEDFNATYYLAIAAL